MVFLLFYWVFSTIVSFVAVTEQHRHSFLYSKYFDGFVDFVGSVVYGWLYFPFIIGKTIAYILNKF